MTFETATALAILEVGRNPSWKPQDRTSGAPNTETDGEFLENAPVTHVDIRMRENLRYRRGRVSVEAVETNETYRVEVRQSTASYDPGGGASAHKIVNGLKDAINALRLDVRARTIDQDGDNNDDEVWLESNHTCLHADSVANSEDYTVIVEGTAATYTSDSSATAAEIVAGLESAVDQSSAPADAIAVDTDSDGDVDTLFIKPVDHGTLETSVQATGTASLTVDARGAEADNPHYGLPGSSGSAELALDADAVEVDARFFGHPVEGENADDAPGGWRVRESWSGIGYRGLSERVLTASLDRGYLEIINPNEGTVRSASLGPVVEE